MRHLASTLGLALVLAACSADPGTSKPASDAETVILPGPQGAAPLPESTSAPAELAGVDTTSLSDRERRTWWKAVSQLYAPCSDQAVSIVECVEKDRPCAACRPAASLLAQKVHAGATPADARAVYATRFGPNVKKVVEADSPARGPEGAPVQIVVWSDFQCPHCRMTMPILDGIFKKYAGKIRLVHKFYPLHAHTTAEPAARAAIAAQNQGRYWEMEQLLFAHQNEQTDVDLERYADLLKLDLQRFRADLKAERTGKILERDHADADRSGLTGTPFILINGREFDLAYFHPETELDPWVSLELELAAGGGSFREDGLSVIERPIEGGLASLPEHPDGRLAPMEHLAPQARTPVVSRPRSRDQIVVLRNIPWEQYDGLCEARKDSAGPRMAYLDGTLEIMSPARKHEYEKTLIARLVETYGEETGLSLNGFGSETFRKKAEDAGVEPDECYCVGPAKKFPDFAIEVIHKSGDLDKLEIYRRLKVTEVWFWQKGRFWIHRLTGRRYALRERSEVLPELDLDELARIVSATDESHQTEAVRAYRRSLRPR